MPAEPPPPPPPQGEVVWHERPPVAGNPIVFFDVALAGTPGGRVAFELFADVCPKTCENFRQLCTGEHRRGGVPMGYKVGGVACARGGGGRGTLLAVRARSSVRGFAGGARVRM